MPQVFAGFVVGFALSILATPLAAIALVRSNQNTGFVRRAVPPGTNFVALSMVLHFGALITFTAAGMVLGLALDGIDARRPANGFGSPNAAYTLLVIALTAVAVIPALLLPAVRRYALAGGLVFVLAFGWAMPWLAEAGK
jgi:hypothetical protein